MSALLVAQMRRVLQTCALTLDPQVGWQTLQALQRNVLILLLELSQALLQRNVLNLLELSQALALTRKDLEVLPLTVAKALRTPPPICQRWVS